MPAGDGARRRADDRSDLSAARRAPAAAPYRPPPARGEGRARDAGRDARLPLPGSAGARRWEESARPRAELQALRAPKFLKSPLPLPLPVKHAAMPPRKKLQGPRAPKFPKSPLPLPLPVKPVATPPRKKRGARPAAKQPPSPPRQKQGARPAAKQPPSPPPPPEPSGPDAPVEEKLRWSMDQEFILRKAAIRAIQAAETESVLSRLHLVRSYMSKEQLETPALQFFQENLPNVSVVRNEEQGELELKWKNWDDIISGDQRDDKVSGPSLATAAGFHFSGDSVQKNFIESSFVLNNFNWSELPKSQTIGAPDSLQTSGATTSRLSFGMTPKSVRQPKNGEMLLSLHGSPLGMYKEENLAAITESGNGSEEPSHDAAGHQ